MKNSIDGYDVLFLCIDHIMGMNENRNKTEMKNPENHKQII